MREHARRAACGRRDMEAIAGDAPDDAVVHDEAGLVQHQAVAAAPDGELGPRVGVEPLQELGRVRADDLDLAERRGVENADVLAHRQAFAIDRGVHRLARPWKVERALPLTDVLEHRPQGLRLSVHGRAPDRIEQIPARMPGEGPERHRRIGRAERRQADFRDRPVERAGRDGEPVHVRRLALVGRHAGRGVALDMLDRSHALAHGEPDVLGRHIVLEVDEGLHLLRVARMRNGPMETAGGRDRAGDREGALARRARSSGAGAMALGERGGEIEGPVAGADRCLRLRRGAGHIDFPLRIEVELAARLREEMHRRRPAARHEDEIAADPRPRRHRTIGTEGAQLRRADAGAARRPGHDGRGQDPQAGRPREHMAGAGGRGPDVGDRRDFHPRPMQVERRAIAGIVGGEYDRELARPGAIAIEIGPRRRGEHHARAIVVRKHQRALDRAGASTTRPARTCHSRSRGAFGEGQRDDR